MKVFISQPTRDRPDNEIKEARDAIINMCRYEYGESIEILESYDTGLIGVTPVKALARSLEALADADGVFFEPGWDKARRCVIEHEICQRYGINIIHD